MVRRLIVAVAAAALVFGVAIMPAAAHPKGQGDGCGCHRVGAHTAFGASGGKVNPRVCMRCHVD